MSQYKVTYLCGHTGTLYSYNGQKYSESYIYAKSQELCPDCQIAKKNKKAAELSEAMKLPQLIGTEKQVNWGNSIRLKIIKSFPNIIRTELHDLIIPFDGKELKKAFEYVKTNIKEASFWIELNHASNIDLFTTLLTEYEKCNKNEEQK